MLRIVCISDTHGLHMHLGHPLPPGDVIVHSGDFCNEGSMLGCAKFFHWFNALPYKYRICIAGNHDEWLEHASPSDIKGILPPDVCYLNDSGVTIEGVKFWGSPISPTFFNWAFNRDRGSPIQKHWDLIPKDTDVLLTHGPARGLLDTTHCSPDVPKLISFSTPAERVGCSNLLNTIKGLDHLKLHVCGHVHSGYGHAYLDRTLYVNASQVNEAYQPVNKPIVVDVDELGANIVHI